MFFLQTICVTNQIIEEKESNGNEQTYQVHFFVFPWYPFTYIINLFSNINGGSSRVMWWKASLWLDGNKNHYNTLATKQYHYMLVRGSGKTNV